MADILLPIAYGAITLAVLGLALASKRHLLIRLGFILLSAWGLCNAATVLIGFARAPLLIPLIDAGLALSVPLVAGKSRVASVVFGIYVALGIVHVDAFLTHTQGLPSYYATLNALYLLQLLAVGGASGASLAARPRGSALFPRLHLGGARMDVKER